MTTTTIHEEELTTLHPFHQMYERGRRDCEQELSPELRRLQAQNELLRKELHTWEVLDRLRWGVCLLCIVIGFWGYFGTR